MKNILNRFVKVVVFFLIAYAFIDLTPYYIEDVIYEKDEIRFVIDDSEKTKVIPDKVIIENDNVMLSLDTIKKFFDPYIYYDENYKVIIASKDIYVVKMFVDNHEIIFNDVTKLIETPVKQIGDDLYVPIVELEDVYGINVEVNEKVVVTTENKDYVEVTLNKPVSLKKFKKELSLTKGKSKKEDKLKIYAEDFDKLSADVYVWVRNEIGDLGYVRKDKLRFDKEKSVVFYGKEQVANEPIGLVWEYAENYTPDRSADLKKAKVDVMSPTWLYVKNADGEIRNTIDKDYLSWANRVGYKVWPTIKNDDIGIANTSLLVTDMYKRKEFVDNVVAICKEYNFSGINLDFENMYEEDKEEFAELVRELSCTLRRNDIVSTVDVNVPDGAPTWSLCYDTKAISEAADYVMLMAYDQYGQSSNTPGPVASLAWVEANLVKLIERDKVNSEKLVLCVPFYSRYWRTKDGVVKSTVALTMEKAKGYVKSNSNSVEWNERAGQYIVEYISGADTVFVYVEDEKALREKLKLIEKYDLAGYAAWRRGFETDDVWNVIAEEIK